MEGTQLESAALQLMELYVFALAAIAGYHLIHRVPPLLHTPLMSATNAISAISVVGALLVAGGEYSEGARLLGIIAVAAAMTNVVGGFAITERMLAMFRSGRGAGSAKGGDERAARGHE